MFEEYGIDTIEINGEADKCKYAFATNTSLRRKTFKFIENRIFLIGDIEIFNTEELLEKYFPKSPISSEMTDEELISYLYLKKGIEFIKELEGEYSFVLYDEEAGRIFAIRDHMGVKPVYWMQYKGDFLIASDIFLLKSYFDFGNLNHNYFKEFYTRDGIVDLEITPYKEVYRVPSGSYISLSKDVTDLKRYWDLADTKGKLAYRNAADYYDEFIRIFQTAIKDRLRKNSGNSIFLSGGLDSTSVYAISKIIEDKNHDLSVTPISAVFDELKDCDERIYINELLNRYRDSGINVNLDDKLMFTNFPQNIPFSYEPSVNAISYEFNFNLAKQASQNGLTNILSGFAGDHLLTGSMYVTRDFLKKIKLKKAVSYITNYSISTNSSAFQNLLAFSLKPDILNQHGILPGKGYYDEMHRNLKKVKSFYQKEPYYQITNAKANLFSDRVIGAITGTDLRHPFLDKRLIEYVYKIPSNLILFDGRITKYILRKSMNNYLPESILNRVVKTTHLSYTYKSMRKNWEYIYKIMSNPRFITSLNLITADRWINELYKWRNGDEVHNKFWILFVLELWAFQYSHKM
ncbi:Asparagine synthetase [glutamine-hydrolyzing] 3 [compost metagenome]